jgi:hypothetical protein
MWSFLFKLVFSGKKKENSNYCSFPSFFLFCCLSLFLFYYLTLSCYQQQQSNKTRKNNMTEIPILCRVQALYPFKSNDPSSLSFEQDDYIEVLTKLPSGWWDGL